MKTLTVNQPQPSVESVHMGRSPDRFFPSGPEYRVHFGQIPLRVEQDFGPCDVAAALTPDGKTLTIGVMDPTDQEVALAPALTGKQLAGSATRWHITGPMHTTHNTPGQPRVVEIQRTEGINVAAGLRIPALSAAVFRLSLKR